MWYTRDQQPFRAGIFYSCNGLGAIIGGILTFGIGQIHTIAVWRAIYLIQGGVTVAWGIVMFVFLPDDIISAKRFNLEDKALLISRSRLGRTGFMNHQIKWYQIRKALNGPQVWILFFFTLCNEIITGGIASFGKLIIKGLTDDPLRTLCTGNTLGAFQVFYILSGTFLASRFRNCRTIVMPIYLIPTIIGTCLMWKLSHKTNKVGVLFGYYIVGAYVCSLVLSLQMPATNLGGYTKRSSGVALVFLAYCVGNIIGPHSFLAREAPLYQTGCRVILACASAQVVLAICLRLLLIRRNKRRDAQVAAFHDGAGPQSEYDELADMTDFEVRAVRVKSPLRKHADVLVEPKVPIRVVMCHDGN